MNATIEIDQLKDAHRATWDSGDYARVARELVQEVGETAAIVAAPQPGDRVLDVATGSGNAAIPAARAGARVTGLDLAPSLIAIARERARAEGVDVEWVVGDAEALPYPDAGFDKAMSAIGVQFAPRHEVVAAELARVVRPGGTVTLCNWTPAGFIGGFLKHVGPRMPKPPEGASPPPPWGDPDHVRALFARTGVEFEFECRTVRFERDSAAGFVDYMAEHYGPLLKARERLEPNGTWGELRAELVDYCEEVSVSTDPFIVDSEYLVAHGRKAA